VTVGDARITSRSAKRKESSTAGRLYVQTNVQTRFTAFTRLLRSKSKVCYDMVEAGSCLNSLPDHSFVTVLLGAALAESIVSSAVSLVLLLTSPACRTLLVPTTSTAPACHRQIFEICPSLRWKYVRPASESYVCFSQRSPAARRYSLQSFRT